MPIRYPPLSRLHLKYEYTGSNYKKAYRIKVFRIVMNTYENYA